MGIVVKESLRDPSLTPPVVASKRGTDWTLLLVHIPADELPRELEALRTNLDRAEPWYAHFFRGDELVVVFDDEVFWASPIPRRGMLRSSMAGTAASLTMNSTSRQGRSQRSGRSSACTSPDS